MREKSNCAPQCPISQISQMSQMPQMLITNKVLDKSPCSQADSIIRIVRNIYLFQEWTFMKTKSEQQENLLILLFRALSHHNTWGKIIVPGRNTWEGIVLFWCSLKMGRWHLSWQCKTDHPEAIIGDYQNLEAAGGGAAAAAAACWAAASWAAAPWETKTAAVFFFLLEKSICPTS